MDALLRAAVSGLALVRGQRVREKRRRVDHRDRRMLTGDENVGACSL